MDIRYLSDYFIKNICPIPPNNERKYDKGDPKDPKTGKEKKGHRPYFVVCLDDYFDEFEKTLFVAVPICHFEKNNKNVDFGRYGYLCFDKKRDKDACLDYRKMLLISDEKRDFCGQAHSLSTVEYNHINKFQLEIVKEVIDYIRGYIEKRRKGKYVHHCTLCYFDDELNL